MSPGLLGVCAGESNDAAAHRRAWVECAAALGHDRWMNAAIEPSAALSSTHSWVALEQAATADELCVAWLQVLCTHFEPGAIGLLLLAQPDGAFAPVATHPPQRDLAHLRDVATRALRSRETVVDHDDPADVRIACPLMSGESLQGAVVLQLGCVDSRGAEEVTRIISWGGGWIIGLLHQRELAEHRDRLREGSFLLDTLLGLITQRTPREAQLALVNRLGRALDSTQVHLALARRRGLTLQAMSHAAWFEERSGLLAQALQAMHETFDQRRMVFLPLDPQAAAAPASAAHRRYALEAGVPALLSVPLMHEGQVAAVLLLERSTPFSESERRFIDSVAQSIAPALVVQQEAAIGPLARMARAARKAVQLILGPRYPAAKLAAALGALLVAGLALWPVPFRISAQAAVEGSIQRAAVAPFEGFLREASARAGDVVRAGQVLALLDDRDLKLERVRWESELEVALRKEREAMAAGKAVDQRLAAAQAAQARAQLDLAISRLDRVRITAPFDGTVVKGDLSQQLGTPVEQGKVLFELAPLDAWRVVLKVDERDVGFIQLGAQGELLLTSLPGRAWPFSVSKLMPVSVAEDGRNHFRVEAQLAEGAPALRPNMEGIGKVSVGQASLLWIWSRSLIDWVRLTWWKWSV